MFILLYYFIVNSTTQINTTNTITRFKYYLEKELHEIQRCDFQNYNKDTEFLAPNFFYRPVFLVIQVRTCYSLSYLSFLHVLF